MEVDMFPNIHDQIEEGVPGSVVDAIDLNPNIIPIKIPPTKTTIVSMNAVRYFFVLTLRSMSYL